MGFKRPFDDEELQELPCKHSRQLDASNKLTEFQQIVPFSHALQKPNISGVDKDEDHKHKWQEASENGTVVNEFANSVEKDFETSATLSWVTSSSSEEDVVSRPTAYASLSLEHFGYDFPRRTFARFENSYSSLLDHSPNKQVPLGPNHQASLPSWGSYVKRNISDCKATMNDNSFSSYLGSDNIVDKNNEEKLMGTCVIPMPDSSSPAHSDNVGEGITDCDCLDEGSVRCVQQHIMEARKRLLKSLGNENFVRLGLCDMGEVVSRKWSEEEEQVFYDAVYSNPASLGRNFWKHLSVVFPSRTKKEIVSYYFNVFMLRRRATQNRCYSLDIDSDDDEWHGSHGVCNDVQISGEDEDSAIESPVAEDEQTDSEEDCSDEDDDDDGDDSDGDVGNCGGDATEEDYGIDHISQACVKSFDGNGFDSVVSHLDTIPGRGGDSFNVQDDSCMSFEFDMVNSCGPLTPLEAGHALPVSGMKNDSKCLHGRLDECNDLVSHVNLMDPCDDKVWDGRYPSLIKGVDLLPTCNIIEEIFGQGTWDTKTRYD